MMRQMGPNFDALLQKLLDEGTNLSRQDIMLLAIWQAIRAKPVGAGPRAATEIRIVQMGRSGVPLTAIGALIFDKVTIRNTATRDGVLLLNVPTKDWSYIFLARNQHNQAVTLQLRGSLTNTYGGAGDVAGSRSVPANSVEIVAVEQTVWAPYLGFSAAYTTAPTSGELTIEGVAMPPDV